MTPKIDVQKAKCDIIYFAENVLGITGLSLYQKTFLQRLRNPRCIVWGRHSGRTFANNVIKEHMEYIKRMGDVT